MYNSQSQVNLGQYLADVIQNQANQGPVQYFVWQLASQNNYNNQLFSQLVNTLSSVVTYWASTPQYAQQSFDQAAMMVYMCACGIKFAGNQQLASQVSQQDGANWMSWAQHANQLEMELNDFEAQMQTRYAPVTRAQNPWDTAQYAGNQSGWGYQPPQPVNNVADWASRPSAVAAPAARSPTVNHHGPQKSGFVSRSARYRDSSPAREVTPPDNNAAPQFTQARPNWRSRSASQAFNPTDPVHEPVGREVAEAHEHAASASGSWSTSNFEWDDPSVEFSKTPEPTSVKSTNTNTPQFMERFSSNSNVGGLVYDKDVNGQREELTIEDWRTKPDPEFPWELGYRPATHTRRIAYDTKRKCFVQQIEENKVKYEDHAVLNQSAAVRTTLGSRSHRGAVERGFAGDSSKVATLPGMIEERSQIIDRRLEAAKKNWDKQEEEAQAAIPEGGNYVAPELQPSRDEAMSTPLDNESEEQITLADGKLTNDQLITVELGNTGFASEQHAAFAMQAKLVVDGFDFSDVPVVSARYLELTPFVLSVATPEEVLEKLEALTDDTTLKSFIEIANHLKDIAADIPTDIWNAINDQLTVYLNGVLHTELGLGALSIESFAEDAADLPEYLRTKKGPEYLEALSRRILEFIRPMLCVVNTNLTDTSFDEIMANLFPNTTPESTLVALDVGDRLIDRTVLVRRECTLSRTSLTSLELGVFAESSEFVITQQTAPDLYAVLVKVLTATARDDGKAGYFKRVLLTADGVRFTLHEGWMAKDKVLILKR